MMMDMIWGFSGSVASGKQPEVLDEQEHDESDGEEENKPKRRRKVLDNGKDKEDSKDEKPERPKIKNTAAKRGAVKAVGKQGFLSIAVSKGSRSLTTAALRVINKSEALILERQQIL